MSDLKKKKTKVKKSKKGKNIHDPSLRHGEKSDDIAKDNTLKSNDTVKSDNTAKVVETAKDKDTGKDENTIKNGDTVSNDIAEVDEPVKSDDAKAVDTAEVDSTENSDNAAKVDDSAKKKVKKQSPPSGKGGKKKIKVYKRKRMGYLRRLAVLLCISVMAISAYYMLEGYLEYKEGDDLYEDLESSYVFLPPVTKTPTPKPTAVTEIPRETENPEETEEIVSPEISYVQDYAPDAWPEVDFDGLRSINGDTSAWILAVGTNINYPVVHSQDNNEYLTKMFDGRTSKLGTIFIDARNNDDFTDYNTIVYGHNMRNHSMFWTVTQYRHQSFYDEHSTVRLITPEGKYEVQLFAAFAADALETSVWDTWFRTKEEFSDWIKKMKDKSMVRSKYEVTADDRIVTLSTCTYDFKDARFLVMGKLVAVD